MKAQKLHHTSNKSQTKHTINQARKNQIKDGTESKQLKSRKTHHTWEAVEDSKSKLGQPACGGRVRPWLNCWCGWAAVVSVFCSVTAWGLCDCRRVKTTSLVLSSIVAQWFFFFFWRIMSHWVVGLLVMFGLGYLELG